MQQPLYESGMVGAEENLRASLVPPEQPNVFAQVVSEFLADLN